MRSMHTEILKKICETDCFLRGVSIPAWIHTELGSLKDNISDASNGESFLTNEKSSKNLNFSRKWVLERVLRGLNDQEIGDLVLKCHRVVDFILTIVPLVGGAPGCGAELGKLQIRKTESMRRTVFSNGPHCVIVPMHCSKRKVRGGRVIPRTRYLDMSNTSVLNLF